MPATTKRKPRGPDLRPRLKAGELRCEQCEEPLLEAVAVIFNGHPFHPVGCFPKALGERMAAVRAAVGGRS